MRAAGLLALLLVAHACHASPLATIDDHGDLTFSLLVTTDSPGRLDVELAVETSVIDIVSVTVNESLFSQPNPGDNPFIDGSPEGGDTTGLWLDPSGGALFAAYGAPELGVGTFEVLRVHYGRALGERGGSATMSGLVTQEGQSNPVGRTTLLYLWPRTGDYDGAGTVGDGDLTLLLGNWGAPVPPIPAGWYGDQPTAPWIGDDELTSLLSAWGEPLLLPVPEPAASLLAGLGVAVACCRRSWYSVAA